MSSTAEEGAVHGEGFGKVRSPTSARMAKPLKNPSTQVKPSVPAPAIGDIAEWRRLVAADEWSGYLNEEILAAYDHYKVLGTSRYGSAEYELGYALLRQLVRAYCARIHSKIPLNGPGHASESESARLTAMAIVRSGINDPSSPTGLKLRQHFNGVVNFAVKTAKRLQLGRADRSTWAAGEAARPGPTGPQRRFLSIEALPEADVAAGGVSAFDSRQVLERLGLVDDPRRRLDLQMQLSRAILEVTDVDMQLILLWTGMGYSAEELAPVFGCTPPTIRNRLHAFGRSRHLAHLRE